MNNLRNIDGFFVLVAMSMLRLCPLTFWTSGASGVLGFDHQKRVVWNSDRLAHVSPGGVVASTIVIALACVALMGLLCLGGNPGEAAIAGSTLYFKSAGVDNDWSNVLNWWEDDVHTVAHGAVPLATDDVVLNAAASNCDLDAAGVCKTFVGTDCITNFHFAENLTVSGSAAFGSGMTITADVDTRQLIVNATATVTTNSSEIAPFPCEIELQKPNSTAMTVTMGDDWWLAGDIVGNVLHASTLNVTGTHIIYAGKGYRRTGLNGSILTSTNCSIVLNGSGTIVGASGVYTNINIDINSSLGSIDWDYINLGANTLLTYTACANLTGNKTLRLATAGIQLDLNGITVGDVIFAPTPTSVTLLNSGFTCTSIDAPSSNTYSCTGYAITVSGNCSLYNMSGTTKFILQGGTLSINSLSTGVVNPVEIAGDVTFSGTVNLARGTGNTGSLTFASGTPVFTDSTIKVVASAGAAYPIVMNDAGNTLNALTIEDDTAISGTQNFSIATMIDTTDGTAITIAAGLVVTITTAITIKGNAVSRITLRSATPGSPAYLNVGSGVTQDIAYVSVTDIYNALKTWLLNPGGLLSNTSFWTTKFASRGGGSRGKWGSSAWAA